MSIFTQSVDYSSKANSLVSNHGLETPKEDQVNSLTTQSHDFYEQKAFKPSAHFYKIYVSDTPQAQSLIKNIEKGNLEEAKKIIELNGKEPILYLTDVIKLLKTAVLNYKLDFVKFVYELQPIPSFYNNISRSDLDEIIEHAEGRSFNHPSGRIDSEIIEFLKSKRPPVVIKGFKCIDEM